VRSDRSTVSASVSVGLLNTVAVVKQRRYRGILLLVTRAE